MPFLLLPFFSNNSTESNEDTNGLEIAKYIKTKAFDPVMILSGNTSEDIIVKGFDLGVMII
jgi:DNA-binding response OmpR family regulator